MTLRSFARRSLRSWTRRHSCLVSAFALSAAASGLGCGASPEGAEGETASALKVVAEGGGVADAICNVVNSMGSVSVGPVTISSNGCASYDFENLYYLGADYSSGMISRSGPVQPVNAAATAEALYCALVGSNGAHVDATYSPIGRFGMTTDIDIYSSNPAAMQVSGQRRGTLYAFGVPLTIDNEDFTASFPTETQTPASKFSLARTVGHYMDLKTSTSTWSLGGSANFDSVQLNIDFGQNAYFESLNNNLIGVLGANSWAEKTSVPSSSPSWTDAVPSPFLWSTWNSQGCVSTCPPMTFACHLCPNATQAAEHAAAVDAGGNMTDLIDGVLPYTGDQGGMAGPYVYLDPSLNWFEFGPGPGGFATTDFQLTGQTTSADPANPLAQLPSTYIDFGIGLSYDIASLMLNLNMRYSSSMELIQGRDPGTDSGGSGPAWTVKTEAAASSSTALTAELKIANPIGIGPNPILDVTFDIINPAVQNPPAVGGAAISFAAATGTPFYEYATTATGGTPTSNASASIASCLAAPATSTTPPAIASPATWLQDVAVGAKIDLYPCNIQICEQSNPGNIAGVVGNCVWNASTNKLVCTKTSTPCACGYEKADLCDVNGNVYVGTPTGSINSQCANAQ